MTEYLEPLTVADLIKELQALPQGHKACVVGSCGGAYNITQIDIDDRGFIEIYTFNSNKDSANHVLDEPFDDLVGWYSPTPSGRKI